MNNQEIFDIVSKHLLTQNKKAMGESSCAYRAPDGCKCAIGVLIKDEFYSSALEGKTIWREVVRNALKDSGIVVGSKVSKEILLLQALQHMHDLEEPSWWARTLKEIATEFNLEFRV